MDHLFLQKKLQDGLNNLRLKKFNEAFKSFEYLIQNKQTELTGLFYLGITKIEQNKEDEALFFFKKILDKDSQNEHANIN